MYAAKKMFYKKKLKGYLAMREKEQINTIRGNLVYISCGSETFELLSKSKYFRYFMGGIYLCKHKITKHMEHMTLIRCS